MLFQVGSKARRLDVGSGPMDLDAFTGLQGWVEGEKVERSEDFVEKASASREK